MLAGNRVAPGSEPIALALYTGHQFGNFVPQLGDDRAHPAAAVQDGDGQRRYSLKGWGRRPSRAMAMAAPQWVPCCANTS